MGNTACRCDCKRPFVDDFSLRMSEDVAKEHLLGLSAQELRKKALSVGVDKELLYAADRARNPQQEYVDLIIGFQEMPLSSSGFDESHTQVSLEGVPAAPGSLVCHSKVSRNVSWQRESEPFDESSFGDGNFSSYFGSQNEITELKSIPAPQGGATQISRRRHTFSTGAVYDGEWLGIARHGFGIQKWPDGATYQGEWCHNASNGKGSFRHVNGDTYIGEWRCNFAHGLGIYQHSDGVMYEGEFANDQQNGTGFQRWPDKSKYRGQYQCGKKVGFGVYIWPDGSTYSGCWADNAIHGYGIFNDSENCTYHGSWRESMMHGCGLYDWPDGRRYAGRYLVNLKHGFGVLTWPDGYRYEGTWADGHQHGFGQNVDVNSNIRIGEWSAGELVGTSSIRE